jgi:hypothetical protein
MGWIRPERITERWWKTLPTADRRALRRQFRALWRRYRPEDAVAISWVKLTAEATVRAHQVSEEALYESAKRRLGVGRRPSESQVRTHRKKAALEAGTLDSMLKRSEELGVAPRRSLKAILEARREARGGA